MWKNRSVTWIYLLYFFLLVSQCNISLKKQRSRSIFSTLFCCFRDYNVEPPSTNSTSALPPLVEENGGLQKVRLLSYLPVVKKVSYNQGLTELLKVCLNRFPLWVTIMSYWEAECSDDELLIAFMQLRFKTNFPWRLYVFYMQITLKNLSKAF